MLPCCPICVVEKTVAIRLIGLTFSNSLRTQPTEQLGQGIQSKGRSILDPMSGLMFLIFQL